MEDFPIITLAFRITDPQALFDNAMQAYTHGSTDPDIQESARDWLTKDGEPDLERCLMETLCEDTGNHNWEPAD